MDLTVIYFVYSIKSLCCFLFCSTPAVSNWLGSKKKMIKYNSIQFKAVSRLWFLFEVQRVQGVVQYLLWEDVGVQRYNEMALTLLADNRNKMQWKGQEEALQHRGTLPLRSCPSAIMRVAHLTKIIRGSQRGFAGLRNTPALLRDLLVLREPSSMGEWKNVDANFQENWSVSRCCFSIRVDLLSRIALKQVGAGRSVSYHGDVCWWHAAGTPWTSNISSYWLTQKPCKKTHFISGSLAFQASNFLPVHSVYVSHTWDNQSNPKVDTRLTLCSRNSSQRRWRRVSLCHPSDFSTSTEKGSFEDTMMSEHLNICIWSNSVLHKTNLSSTHLARPIFSHGLKKKVSPMHPWIKMATTEICQLKWKQKKETDGHFLYKNERFCTLCFLY